MTLVTPFNDHSHLVILLSSYQDLMNERHLGKILALVAVLIRLKNPNVKSALLPVHYLF